MDFPFNIFVVSHFAEIDYLKKIIQFSEVKVVVF